ncbi:uncharacterized protein [Macrobrachium rosenbergii]|uniref:uncharacterized protein n=1 Tax=Macrobrachium rosenbergii TaxID=79674 RepID=UPI0034D3A765
MNLMGHTCKYCGGHKGQLQKELARGSVSRLSPANGCLGFNWMPGAARKCELLSSLRQVVSDLSCNIYVPDALVRTAVKLEYSCPNCMPSAPLAINTWPHRCDPNGVAVGIASATSFPDLDYLLCVQIPNMMVDMGNGYTCADDTRGCETIASASC